MLIEEYTKELKKSSTFTLFRTWLITQLSGNQGVQTERALEKGMTHGKYSFSAANGNDVIWLNPDDIECFWTEGCKCISDMTEDVKVGHFIRTKSGKDFMLSESSWFKVMYGVNYEVSKD